MIGLSATIFSIWSLSIVAAMVTLIPVVLSRLAPAGGELREMPDLPTDKVMQEVVIPRAEMTPSMRIENARVVTLILGTLAAVFTVQHFSQGGGLNLNTLNMIFLALGLLLADSPRHYLTLLGNAGKVTAPFLVQYPLYAGIMGIIALSGLGAMFVNGFMAVSTAETLPIWTFFSAGFLNLFIPSAGGQWAVQGPIAVDAAMQLGTDIARVAMSLTLGESWTNAIQPLYAIPVLAVAGLHIRDVMGYGVIILGLNGCIYLTGLVFF